MQNISVLNVIVKDFNKNVFWVSKRLCIEISKGFNSVAKKDIRFQNKHVKNNIVLSCNENKSYLYIIKMGNAAKKILCKSVNPFYLFH